jgi:hypothetical protein
MAALASREDVASMDTVDVSEGASGFSTVDPNHPLHRKVVVGIRATLADLVMDPRSASWKPNETQLSSIFMHRKFTGIDGRTEMTGDLRTVVLHSVEQGNTKSTFPIALGASITGVDKLYYSSTGTPHSLVTPPHANHSTSTTLQQDDVSIAYDFASRYPGFTADNLETNGIHAVNQRRFVLVSLNHPLVTAIQENQEKLQMSEIQQMPEQLIKISTGLYNMLMPLLKDQVRAQIKVADFSAMSLELIPADYSSWEEVSDVLTKEAVAPIKAELKRALGRVRNDEAKTLDVQTFYAERIESAMAEVSNTPHEFFVQLGFAYNFLPSPPSGEED